MKLCYWLLLCALTATCYSTELNPEVLAKIVNDFIKDGGTHGPDREKKINQFSFLMALTPEQCTTGKVTYSPHQSNTKKPVIPANPPSVINTYDNYVASRPDSRSTPRPVKKCSEYKLLFSFTNLPSSAVQFKVASGGKILRKGGCVIFFTTNSPCLDKCFSNNDACDIVGPLSAAPFKHWRDRKDVHQYFVYIHQWNADTNDVVNKFREVAEQGFQISRCSIDNNLYVSQCATDCNGPNYCLPKTNQRGKG